MFNVTGTANFAASVLGITSTETSRTNVSNPTTTAMVSSKNVRSAPNLFNVRKVAYIGIAVPTRRSPTRIVASSFCGSLRSRRAILARLLWFWARARSLVSLTAKKPISAVEITAERTIRPNRMTMSIEGPGLRTADDAGQGATWENWGAITLPAGGDPARGWAKNDAIGACWRYGLHDE